MIEISGLWVGIILTLSFLVAFFAAHRKVSKANVTNLPHLSNSQVQLYMKRLRRERFSFGVWAIVFFAATTTLVVR